VGDVAVSVVVGRDMDTELPTLFLSKGDPGITWAGRAAGRKAFLAVDLPASDRGRALLLL
jgi:hypothetical protein